MYTENEIVRVAKRENNQKRKYLVVNVLQGKHVPVQPSKALKMFGELAKIIKRTYEGEKLLLIGFAETATAIGAAIAAKVDCHYIQTTREIIENVDYLFFSEAHSHATEQKLVKNDIAKVINQIDRIIFIEDEVTTGNTIHNIITLLQQEYASSSIKFSIASIINGMDDIAEKRFFIEHINLHYLVKTINADYEEVSEHYRGDGTYHKANTNDINFEYSTEMLHGLVDARRVHKRVEYQNAYQELWMQIKQNEKVNDSNNKDILVIGTEEFMYPALYVASMLESEGNNVRFHATTRSPIMVDLDKNYPLHERFELRSFYDSERITYLYDIKQYDKVFVITDSNNNLTAGCNSLLNALRLCGNENVKVIRWCE
ncbi:MAG: phosphoribosyltransferase domain-containing protein [Clostridiales bacterium]|nr:phosphoribosyltransferase domain-containing protein [Clostridiales bacterium]